MIEQPYSQPIRQKSLRSYDAGELLFKNRFYDHGVHASYNAVVQLFLHIIHELKGVTEKELQNQLTHRPQNTGTHQVCCELVLKKIEFDSPVQYRILKKKIEILKWLRVQADYFPLQCQEKDCKRALSLATDIWNELKRYYQIGGRLI